MDDCFFVHIIYNVVWFFVSCIWTPAQIKCDIQKIDNFEISISFNWKAIFSENFTKLFLQILSQSWSCISHNHPIIPVLREMVRGEDLCDCLLFYPGNTFTDKERCTWLDCMFFKRVSPVFFLITFTAFSKKNEFCISTYQGYQVHQQLLCPLCHTCQQYQF